MSDAARSFDHVALPEVQPRRAAGRVIAGARGLCLPALLLVLVTTLQWATGAFHAEFSAPDESAHYVTGLMIRDYLASRLSTDPVSFATTFYIHYPKVSFGIWPPLYHIVEAVWMLAFSPSRTSVLVLLAVIVSLLGTLLYRVVAREWGRVAGLAVAVVFVTLPTTMYTTSRVNADALVALLSVAAVLLWARVMERQRLRDAVIFGLVGSAAMLTKGNGCALLLVPFLAVLIGGRWFLMERAAFWVGPVLMLVLGGPWQIYSWLIVRGTVVGVGLNGSLVSRTMGYLSGLRAELGVAVLLCAAVGVAEVLRRRGRHTLPAAWAAMTALPVAVVIFQIGVPLAASNRYLLSAMPSLLWLAALGLASAFDLVAPHQLSPRRSLWPAWRSATMGALAVPVLVTSVLHTPRKLHNGVDAVADLIERNSGHENTVVLTSARGEGEGALIAEIAMRDKRPGHIVLRASKVLSRSTWDGGRYELLYPDVNAIRRYLDDTGVDFVVIDNSWRGTPTPDIALLLGAVSGPHSGWHLVASIPVDSAPMQPILVYRSDRSGPRRTPRFAIDMQYSLGRVITLK